MSAVADLRVVFMGTPAFAVHILEGILEHGCQVVGVVTAPDKPAGRGQKLNSSEVKKFALSKGLKVLQPTNLKSPEFISELQELEANLQVVVAFRMLPKIVWQWPKLGTFNLHASLLPKYRGAAPINWAIINGETKTGVTTFFIDQHIDTGAIILQSEVAITPKDTAGTLHDKLMMRGRELVNDTLTQIANNTIKIKPQDLEINSVLAPKLTKDNCKISWNKNGQDILNHVRGLTPYPGAWGLLKQNEEATAIKIYKVSFTEKHHKHSIGTIITDKSSIKIAVKDGLIDLLEFKFPGKKQMDCKSFLNGFSFEKNAIME